MGLRLISDAGIDCPVDWWKSKVQIHCADSGFSALRSWVFCPAPIGYAAFCIMAGLRVGKVSLTLHPKLYRDPIVRLPPRTQLVAFCDCAGTNR